MKSISTLLVYADRAQWLRNQGVREDIITWAQGMDEAIKGKGKFLVWLAMQAKNNPQKVMLSDSRTFANIRDWVRGTNVNLSQYTFQQAKDQTLAWHKELAANGQPLPSDEDDSVKTYVPSAGERVIHTFPDGWVITSLEEMRRLKEEGTTMGNCLNSGGEGYYEECVQRGGAIYSLRDPAGRSHVSMEFSPEGKFLQMQGRYDEAVGNWTPKPAHRQRLYQWLREHPTGALSTKVKPEGVAVKPTAELLSMMPKDELFQQIRNFYSKKK